MINRATCNRNHRRIASGLAEATTSGVQLDLLFACISKVGERSICCADICARRAAEDAVRGTVNRYDCERYIQCRGKCCDLVAELVNGRNIDIERCACCDWIDRNGVNQPVINGGWVDCNGVAWCGSKAVDLQCQVVVRACGLCVPDLVEGHIAVAGGDGDCARGCAIVERAAVSRACCVNYERTTSRTTGRVLVAINIVAAYHDCEVIASGNGVRDDINRIVVHCVWCDIQRQCACRCCASTVSGNAYEVGDRNRKVDSFNLIYCEGGAAIAQARAEGDCAGDVWRVSTDH